ncbi:MAG: sensor histidine kinase [Bacteroidetes bacterium]|nr:sensor histidine kinase [Bacteroidota bacterium]
MKNKNNLQSSEAALRERVKELACLYGISELANQNNFSLNELLENVLKLIPPAWQYPEYTVSRIILDDNHYNSSELKDFPNRLTEKIIINDQHRGSIEVFYIKVLPEADEGPFLKEERKLIQAIAQKLSLIIERKEAAEELKLLQDQIRHADRLATIGELTAGIAHGLNNPLNNILGFAQLIIKNNDLGDQVKQDVEKIIKAALHSREIIKKLMYFTRDMPQDFKKVHLNQVIQDAMYFIEPQCINENISVSYQLDNKLPFIIADSLQLNQVIVNLVVNGIQAMPEGGTLNIKTSFNSQSVFMSIEDTGLGISDKIMQNIFHPFFTTKEIDKGSGLGLSVVHGIITAHNGTIEVKSKEGNGTIFNMEIPIKTH